MTNSSQDQQKQPNESTAARRWMRYAVNLPLRVRVPTEAGHEFMLAHGRDVSQRGMAVYVPVELEVGQTVMVELEFQALQSPLTLNAMIKNRTGFKYGVEFIEPAAQQQEIILIQLRKLVASAGSA